MHDESRHPATEESQLVQIRKEKLQQLRAQGLDPFAVERYATTHTLQQVHDEYATLQGQTVAVAGRIVAIRKMGKATFAHLMDSTGKLQIYLKADEQGDRYNLIDLWDLGDYLGVEGSVFQTRTGEITVHVQQIVLLAKAVRPVPFPKEKGEQRWYELHDVEQRYRQRYLDLLVEDLFRHVAEQVFGRTVFEMHGVQVDFSQSWRRVRLMDAVHERTGLTEADFETLERAVQAAEKVGIYVERKDTVGGIIEKVLEKCVAEHLQQPTFVYGFPLDTSPLAKREPDNPRFTRRFEGYIFGREVANAFSELNDPIEQRARFEQQLALRQAGDEEAHPFDEDFLLAMEYGMPPAGGLGIGIDRMAMLLTGAESIREVIFFPQMREG